MTQWLFAFGAGMLATVNPCGFAMLPAFLAFYLGDGEQARGGNAASVAARLAHGLVVGAAVSAGFAGTFVAAGLLVALGLRSLVGAAPWAAVVVGGLLFVLGLAMLAGRTLSLSVGRNVVRGSGRGFGQMVVFGAAYAVASLSCTLPVLLAVIAQATATANGLQLTGVFAAYGLGSATILVALSLAAAVAKATAVLVIRRVLPYVTRLSGGVLALSGVYLVLYWLPSLTGDGRRPPLLGGAGATVAAQVMAFVDGHQVLVVIAAAAMTLAAGTAVALQRRRTNCSVDVSARQDEVSGCCPSPAEQAAQQADEHG